MITEFIKNITSTPELLNKFVGYIIQFFTIVVTVGIAFYNIRKGYENNIKIQQINFKNEYFRKLHTAIEEVIDNLIDAKVTYSTSLRLILVSFDRYRSLLQNGFQNPILHIDSVPEFHNKHGNLQHAAIEIISTVEKYEIIEPRIKVFQYAFSVALYDLSASYYKLHEQLFNVLPNTNPSFPIPFRMPNPEQEKIIKALIEACLNVTDDICMYAQDMRIEAQNLLLSDFFKRKLDRRQPINPSLKVISTEPDEYDKLIEYFEKETAWGQNKQETERFVRELYKQ